MLLSPKTDTTAPVLLNKAVVRVVYDVQIYRSRKTLFTPCRIELKITRLLYGLISNACVLIPSGLPLLSSILATIS
jgi:hypothetical protein